jgi:hypothetical protein
MAFARRNFRGLTKLRMIGRGNGFRVLSLPGPGTRNRWNIAGTTKVAKRCCVKGCLQTLCGAALEAVVKQPLGCARAERGGEDGTITQVSCARRERARGRLSRSPGRRQFHFAGLRWGC